MVKLKTLWRYEGYNTILYVLKINMRLGKTVCFMSPLKKIQARKEHMQSLSLLSFYMNDFFYLYYLFIYLIWDFFKFQFIFVIWQKIFQFHKEMCKK